MAELIRTLTGQSQKSQQSAGSKPKESPQEQLARTTTTHTQTGVLNHLTSEQEDKLVEFKRVLEKDGWWSPDGVNGKPTHDDGTLLRYLRARKFDVNGAVGQFTDTEKWLKEQKVEELYEHFDVEFYERARLMYPQWTGRRDRRGIPIYVFEIKGLDTKTVNKYQKDAASMKKGLDSHKDLSTQAKLMPLFALYHNLLNFILPLCSTLERPKPEIPVTNSTNIVDISGVSLMQFWNLKQHMQDASVLATAHYPETLDRIFIIGAPSFFPTVWGWIKRWFDPVTVSKIFILGRNEVKPTLESFMEPSSIPKKYGGTLEWKWGEIPKIDDEVRKALETDGNKGWVRGPCLWLQNKRIVVGSENGKLRRSDEEVAEMKPIIYAADYTEDPVHPEKRGSVESKSGSDKVDKRPSIHKTVTTEDARVKSELPSTEVTPAIITTKASTSAPSASAEQTVATPTADEPLKVPTTPERKVAASTIPESNIRTSPMGDSQVHLPDHQPAHPATTAEYISPVASNVSLPPTKQPNGQPIAAAIAPTSGPQTIFNGSVETKSASPTAVPAGHTAPGPLPEHVVELNRKIAAQLQGESVSVIPADANSALPHPDIITASDTSKGLAMEAEKIGLSNGNLPTRPQPERFVTAAEF